MIAPRNVALASLVFLCAAAGCTSYYEIPIETPIQPKMDITPFSRVLVAGFIEGGTDDVDANLETVRLLRSQLRSKSTLRVIEAEALPLAEIAREQLGKTPPAPAAPGSTMSSSGESTPNGTVAPVPQLPAPGAAPAPAAPAAPAAEDTKPRTDKELEQFQALFNNAEFWKKIGAEHQNPLIVT